MVDRSTATWQEHRPAAVSGGGPSLVLAGFDRTEGSGHALAYAVGLAARTGARLVVLNVNESLALDCPIGVQDCAEEIAGEVQEVVAGCPGGCEVAVDTGDPAGVIQRIATELQADLIVVGRARRRWTHPFGSVPARLARHAVQPVLVVP